MSLSHLFFLHVSLFYISLHIFISPIHCFSTHTWHYKCFHIVSFLNLVFLSACLRLIFQSITWYYICAHVLPWHGNHYPIEMNLPCCEFTVHVAPIKCSLSCACACSFLYSHCYASYLCPYSVRVDLRDIPQC